MPRLARISIRDHNNCDSKCLTKDLSLFCTADLLPQRPLRASPYLYSDADIAALIAATRVLRTPLRQATFATLIGTLAVTGIRVGEAIALNRGDADLARSGITCRAAPRPGRRAPMIEHHARRLSHARFRREGGVYDGVR